MRTNRPHSPTAPRRRIRRGRLAPSAARFRFRPHPEAMEDRALLSTFLVTNTDDAGPGSLRQAILDVDADSGGAVIDFAIAGAGVHTIAPASPLPPITGSVLVDGTSQPGYAGAPLIAIDASSSGMADGLTIAGPDVTVRGLAAGGFALGAGNLPGALTLQSGPLRADAGGAGRVETDRIDTSGEGRLVAQVHSPGLTTRLSLLDERGRVLVQSDGISPSLPEGRIDQHLPAGTYSLQVVTTAGAGDVTLTATLTPASTPYQAIRVGSHHGIDPPLVVGDFNGDGIADLAEENGVHLGLGDGTFRQPSVGLGLSDAYTFSSPCMGSGDFNRDGKLDLAATSWETSAIGVLLGNGDGSFRAPTYYAVGTPKPPVGYKAENTLAAGDFNGDGLLDLTVANGGSDDVSVLLGRGDGTFQPAVDDAVGSAPWAVVAGDFNGDGRLDLASANRGSNDVSVLLGDGDGTLQSQRTYAAGSDPWGLVAGDFNGDGRLDLVVAGSNDTDRSVVTVWLGDGDGTFQPQQPFASGAGGSGGALVAGDFDGDGRLDLATTSVASTVFVLLGNGDGTFQARKEFASGIRWTFSLAAGDFNGDGRLDLATAHAIFGTISVLLNDGVGPFSSQGTFATAGVPATLARGDFNGDGRLDLAAANASSNDISVLLGNGDGTLQPQKTFAVGFFDFGLVAADFNGDGRLDLAAAGWHSFNYASGELAVLLGNGDGTFQPAKSYATGSWLYKDSLVAGDFDGDGKLDLAAGNMWGANDDISGSVIILLGDGDGTFQSAKSYAVPPGITDEAPVVAGDFDGDGHLDVAMVDTGDGGTDPGGVFVLLGDGDGTFQPAKQFAAGGNPSGLSAGDFDGDGRLDLATAGVGGIAVLLGNGDGTFQAPKESAGEGVGVVAGDFNGDGRLDLAITYDTTSVLLGNGDGTFQATATIAAATYGRLLAAGDFNGDGRLDLATTNSSEATSVSMLVGNGDGTFADPGQLLATPHATPLVADVDGDGTEDVLVVDGAGRILERRGLPGHPGTYDPPVAINPGFPSRDIAWATRTTRGPLLASVDARDDAVSLYAWRDGGFVRVGSLATGRLPAQVLAADLDGDGLCDLVVRVAGAATLSISFGNGFDRGLYMGPLSPGFLPPSFLPALELPAGPGASDVVVADTTGTGRLDLLLTHKVTGQVNLVQNLGDRMLLLSGPYRAGTGLSGLDTSSGAPVVISQEATAGAAAGPLTPGAPIGLVVINAGSNTLGVLAGLGRRRFANPVALATRAPASVIRLADFDHDGVADLALISARGVDIAPGDGAGGFRPPVTYDAGPEPTGLTVADLDHDGHPDLLIGNPYGDVLALLGQGDGTFRPYRQADQAVALAVADLTGDGRPEFIYADQALDRVTVQYGTDRTAVLGDQSTGLLAPGAVKLADLNGDGIPDLIVGNSGSNNVLVYPGLGGGQFAPAANGGHGFFTGTNPTSLAVADLNSDGLADLLVANAGSNDVSVLLSQGTGPDWTLAPGPRIKTDAGPVAVAAGDIMGNGHTDLAVANRQANTVQVFPGVGGGFFNDQAPRTYAVGQAPAGLFLGNFDGTGTEIAALNAGSNSVSLIGPAGVIGSYAAGGQRPVSGFAGDFNGDGLSDLVVGNGDGRLALLVGGPGGLSISQTLTSPEAPAPTALSFAGLSGGLLSFYVASAGREAAVGLAFDLAAAPGAEAAIAGLPIVAVFGPSAAALAQAAVALVQPVGQLLSFNGTALDLVTTLLSVAMVAGPAEAEAGGVGEAVAPVASFQPAAGGLGQALGAARAEEGHTDDEPGGPPEEAPGPVTEAAVRSLPPWARLAVGLAGAWERARAEELQRAGRPEANPAHRPAGPPPRVPAGSRLPAGSESRAEPPGEDGPPAASGVIPASDDPRPRPQAAEVIDAAIGHLAAGVETRLISSHRPEALAATALLALAIGAERFQRGARSHRPRVAAAMSQPTSPLHTSGSGTARGR